MRHKRPSASRQSTLAPDAEKQRARQGQGWKVRQHVLIDMQGVTENGQADLKLDLQITHNGYMQITHNEWTKSMLS